VEFLPLKKAKRREEMQVVITKLSFLCQLSLKSCFIECENRNKKRAKAKRKEHLLKE
jgi:hypothetical protein